MSLVDRPIAFCPTVPFILYELLSSSTSVQAESNSYKINGTVGQNAIGLSTKDIVFFKLIC
jgi:hypothetical protein